MINQLFYFFSRDNLSYVTLIIDDIIGLRPHPGGVGSGLGEWLFYYIAPHPELEN